MKYLLVIITAASLVACGGSPQQALPPELMGETSNNLSGAVNDPLSGLPFKTPNEAIEESIEVVEENNEAQTTVGTEAPSSIPSVEAANCEALTNDLETSFADMNFCETNDDCQVAQGSCPFGCYLFHNAAIDFADYQPSLEVYQSSCNPCEYRCAEPPRAADRRCVEGRCVDARNQN